MKYQVIIGKEFPEKVIPLIERAKKTIKTIVYDWRWYPNDPGNAVQLFNQAMIRAVKRGVKIQAIVNHEGVCTVLSQNGVSVKKIKVQGLVHAKLMIIDDDLVIIGSHNYSHNAFVLNQEISVILSEIENIEDFNIFFRTLWQ